jgi:hypothetical protein
MMMIAVVVNAVAIMTTLRSLWRSWRRRRVVFGRGHGDETWTILVGGEMKSEKLLARFAFHSFARRVISFMFIKTLPAKTNALPPSRNATNTMKSP